MNIFLALIMMIIGILGLINPPLTEQHKIPKTFEFVPKYTYSSFADGSLLKKDCTIENCFQIKIISTTTLTNFSIEGEYKENINVIN